MREVADGSIQSPGDEYRSGGGVAGSLYFVDQARPCHPCLIGLQEINQLILRFPPMRGTKDARAR
jgi:hypothetical protein